MINSRVMTTQSNSMINRAINFNQTFMGEAILLNKKDHPLKALWNSDKTNKMTKNINKPQNK